MRQEFTKAVKVEIIKRATDAQGNVRCERCGCVPKRFEIDHIIADGLRVDKTRPLTADDGELLCKGYSGACHDLKTATADVPAIAKAKRREAAHLGVKTEAPRKIQSRGFEKSQKTPRINKAELDPLPRRRLYVDIEGN